MGTSRIEAFSDGVIAIIITIMVLELKLPTEGSGEALAKVAPTMLSYMLSFVVVAIMWVNHHQLMHAAKHRDGRLLWDYTEPLPVAVYGVVMTLAGLSFTLLRPAIA